VFRYFIFCSLTLGVYDVSEESLHKDEKAIKFLAGLGIPVACFLHGYAGFIFGSVKANALWMTPLMPVIFIMSAIVWASPSACLPISDHGVPEVLAKRRRSQPGMRFQSMEEIKSVEMNVIQMTASTCSFPGLRISLELLDLISVDIAVKSWDVLRSVIYGRTSRAFSSCSTASGTWSAHPVPDAGADAPEVVMRLLVLFGVFMMRWNVVIGGRRSPDLHGLLHYHLPIIRQHGDLQEGLMARSRSSSCLRAFLFHQQDLPGLRAQGIALRPKSVLIREGLPGASL